MKDKITSIDKVAAIPKRVGDLARDVLEAAKSTSPVSKSEDFRRNLVADCCTLFVQMYRVREIPARKEAVRLGSTVIHAASQDAPYRNRLNVGLPWTSVVAHLQGASGARETALNSTMTSLALDVCNDLGVALPHYLCD